TRSGSSARCSRTCSSRSGRRRCTSPLSETSAARSARRSSSPPDVPLPIGGAASGGSPHLPMRMAAVEYACLARQPIYDAQLDVCGYELLYRAAPRDESAKGTGETDDAMLSAATLTAALTDIGLDEIVGDRPAWVNVGSDVLLGHLSEVLPPDRVVVEILDSLAATPAIVEAMAALKRTGYRFALDDVSLRPGIGPVLALADVVKIDVLAHADDLERQTEILGRGGADLLALKVEDHDMLDRCRTLGFTLFQGNVFSRP